MVLAGPANRLVVAALRAAGLDAIGLSGVDGGLLTARPAPGGLGHVGEIAGVRASLLESLLLAGLTPVIAPMAPGPEGGLPLNVNADEAAAAVAAAVHAAELLFVSDVPGVQVDGAVQPALDAGDVGTLIELGAAPAGLAVLAVRYDHPVIRDAIDQALASGLLHVSNLYRTEPGERLAEELVARAFASRVFFCNSGAEANEAAFKFARKWSGKSEIVAFSGSFHGRLFATLAATDRPEYRKPFEPLVPGIRIVPREDWAAVDHAVSASRTAAVIVEPVQGEGGVRPIDPEWLGFLRELCDSRGVAVIFDEVQCGLGRTGTLFAYGQPGVVPDILTLAKPLAGGLPMGAVLVTSAVAAALKPGDHAPTFGGGPLGAGVALEVVRTIADPAFLAEVRRKAEWLGAHLARLAARERGLLVVTAGPQVIRLLPPLVITVPELERGLAILEEILA